MAESIGEPRRHLEETTSTNAVAWQWALDGAPHGATVTADTQTHGRGRRGREWASPAGKGLYLSLILRPPIDAARVPQLTLLAALASARAIELTTGLLATTKWPNDVLLHNRKVGGVLCEAELDLAAVAFAVVGVGLNLNFTADELPERPLFPASSLALETGRAWDVAAMTPTWLGAFATVYNQFMADGWEELRQEFMFRCVTIGSLVTVHAETEAYAGRAVGLSDEGLLQVDIGGRIRTVLAGDVSHDNATRFLA